MVIDFVVLAESIDMFGLMSVPPDGWRLPTGNQSFTKRTCLGGVQPRKVGITLAVGLCD
jgi:hypothetical protein